MKRYWVIIPAAGIGSRMMSKIPKQYLPLLNRCVIEVTLSRFMDITDIAGIVVATAKNDPYWPRIAKKTWSKPIYPVNGGVERSDSVYQAMQFMQDNIISDADETWVLIHDAARPCVRGQDIQRLMTLLEAHPIGGILAVPVIDTIKKSDEKSHVSTTICRDLLWQAYTPQMFRFSLLFEALTVVNEKGYHITDDASAMEKMGYLPQLVVGHRDNIKITHADDLALAEFYLHKQGIIK